MNEESPMQRALRETGGAEYEKMLKKKQGQESRSSKKGLWLLAIIALLALLAAAAWLLLGKNKSTQARSALRTIQPRAELALESAGVPSGGAWLPNVSLHKSNGETKKVA